MRETRTELGNAATPKVCDARLEDTRSHQIDAKKTPHLITVLQHLGGAFIKLLTIMIAQPLQTKQLSADGYQWNQYSPRVATITNELLHFAQVCYFAFDSWYEAHRFWKSITDKQVCRRAQVRESERFTSYPWEVKVWAMSVATLEKLIERDTKRYCHEADRKRQLKALPVPPIRRDWSNSASHSAIQCEAA